MMSSIKVNLLSISLMQYFYKLKAYTTLVYGLITAQLIALLFSLGGVSSSGGSSGELSVMVKNYSANIVLIFSLVWIMFIALKLTTKQYKNMEIALVTNRITGNLSNIGMLATACVFGGITASLSGVLFRVVMYFSSDRSQIVWNGFFLAFSDLLLGIIVAILYMFVISALGYFIGVLIQLNGVFAIIVPAVVMGSFKVYADFSQAVLKFLTFENSLPLFALKIICIAIVLFGASLLLSNRMEVGK
ncbi:MAG: hypothetical protein P4L49_13675 [Desulfosporosinus sp.]|nr:hypothetical protein [Desulfosporosinus sp.]